MNFALFLFCASSAAQLLSPAFAAGDTRSASLPLKGTRGGSTSFLARRTLVEDEETDSPETNGSEPPKPSKKRSSTTKQPKEVDAADEPTQGTNDDTKRSHQDRPHKKGPPGHRDCTPCKLLQPIVSSLVYSLSL